MDEERDRAGDGGGTTERTTETRSTTQTEERLETPTEETGTSGSGASRDADD